MLEALNIVSSLLHVKLRITFNHSFVQLNEYCYFDSIYVSVKMGSEISHAILGKTQDFLILSIDF